MSKQVAGPRLVERELLDRRQLNAHIADCEGWNSKPSEEKT